MKFPSHWRRLHTPAGGRRSSVTNAFLSRIYDGSGVPWHCWVSIRASVANDPGNDAEKVVRPPGSLCRQLYRIRNNRLFMHKRCRRLLTPRLPRPHRRSQRALAAALDASSWPAGFPYLAGIPRSLAGRPVVPGCVFGEDGQQLRFHEQGPLPRVKSDHRRGGGLQDSGLRHRCGRRGR